MKKIIYTVSFIFIFSVYSIAQQTEKIVDLPGISKDLIYQRSINWLAEEFVSSKAIIELQDKNQGKIVGNIGVDYKMFIIYLTMKTKLVIDIKDNKARLTFIPIIVHTGDAKVGDRAFNNKDLELIAPEYEKVVDKYKSFIQKKEKDW